MVGMTTMDLVSEEAVTVWKEMVGGGDGCRMEQTGLKNHGGR
jgi:hypothetical protein